jgi:hypothetical protein
MSVAHMAGRGRTEVWCGSAYHRSLGGASRTVPRRTVPLARLQSLEFSHWIPLNLRALPSRSHLVDYVMHLSLLKFVAGTVAVMMAACFGGRMQ